MLFCTFNLILLFFFTFRSISLPAVNKAVAKVTEAGRQTRSTTCANSTPLGSDPPQPKTVTETLEEQSKATQLSIVVSEEDQEVCKPKKMPTAKRAKKLLGPQ